MALSRLRLPIIQAPMAGGYNTPELIAAVANQGCIGSFGFAYSTPQKIEDDLKKTKNLTNGIIGANFFIFNEILTPPSKELEEAAIAALKQLPISQNPGSFTLKPPSPPYFPNLRDQLQPIWKYKPEILTFHFGLPPVAVLEQAKALGISVGISCTSLKDFESLQDFGADFAIAQGIEAGGHRGTFIPNAEEDEFLTIDQLLQRLVPISRIPIVASGGLMTGKDIARVRKLGAAAAQMGTVFLTTTEAGTNSEHRRFILNGDRETALVNTFSGRKARGIRNEFIDRMNGKPFLPFPLQNTLTGSLRKYATEQSNGEYQSLWVGENYRLCQDTSTNELISKLGAEYDSHFP